MKSFKFQRPWLLSVRGIALIVMGLVAIIQQPHTLQPLLLIFALLYGFNMFLALIETIVLKREKLAGFVLVGTLINVLLLLLFVVAFFKYESPSTTIESARYFGLFIIFLTLFWAFITDVLEWIALIRKKNRFAAVFLINSILTLMVAIFFYSFFDGVKEISLRYFGYLAIGTGLIFFVMQMLLNNISKLNQEIEEMQK